MEISTLIFIGIFTGQLLLKTLGDWWYKNKKKRIINHSLSAGIDISVYIVAGYFFIIAPLENVSVLFYTGILFTSLSVRWVLYDLIYNSVNKEVWSYCGNSSIMDIKLDLIDGEKDNDCALGLIIKLGFLVIGGLLIIVG